MLAHVAGENLHWLPDVLAALEPVFGTPVYLRLAARCTLEPGHAIAELHRAWTGRADELLALGPQDRRVEAPELAALPDTLVHGDFHPGNAFFDEDRAVIFDWSDACVAHPLFDLHLYLHELGDRGRRDELVEAYASGWNGDVDADTIRELLPLAAPLSCLHQAESYRAIEAACAPDDRWWFAGEAERWRELACAVSG